MADNLPVIRERVEGGDANGLMTIVLTVPWSEEANARAMKAQKFIDSEVLRLCTPKVPKRDGALISSGLIHTVIGSGTVRYKTPYARRWYYENANFSGAPERGNRWFERMKTQNAQDIKKGAAVILNGKE